MLRGWLILLSALTTCLVGGVADAETKPGYQAAIPKTVEVQVGQEANLPIALVPADEYHIDKNGPLRIELALAAQSAVRIKKRKLRRSDAMDASSGVPRFVVPVLGHRAGQETLTVRFRFWLCRAKICRPVKGSTLVKVNVSPEQATEGGAGDTGPGATSDPKMRL